MTFLNSSMEKYIIGRRKDFEVKILSFFYSHVEETSASSNYMPKVLTVLRFSSFFQKNASLLLLFFQKGQKYMKTNFVVLQKRK